MNKFKDWARWLRPDVEHHDAQEIADYLESLATLADGAPSSEPLQCYQNSISFVTKEYADYYQAKCAVLLAENAKLKHLDAELAAAQHRIAELCRDKEILQSRNPEQPKPVMLNMEQFNSLHEWIRCMRDQPDYYEWAMDRARKALCGE